MVQVHKQCRLLECTCKARREARRRPGSLGFNIIWASTRETLTLLLANNKGTDQPAHTRSLISTIVTRYLKSNVTRIGQITLNSPFYFGRPQQDKFAGYAPER